MGFNPPNVKSALIGTVALLGSALVLMAAVGPVPARAAFGLKEFDVQFTNADGSPDIQAGSHPFAMKTSLGVNTKLEEGVRAPVADDELRDLIVEQAQGLVGDPAATARCPVEQFVTFASSDENSSCPNSTAVGLISIHSSGSTEIHPVFNVTPPSGVAVALGFVAFSIPITIEIRVKHEYPYNVTATLSNVPQPVEFYGSEIVLWGVPADPAHDAYRGNCLASGGTVDEPKSLGDCASGIANVPFLTLPRSCTGPLVTTFQADSWQNPGVFVQGLSETHDGSEPAEPIGLSGCSKLGFSPTITAQPTSEAAQSPTGLDFGLNVHDEGLTNATGVAESDIKKAVVTLPEGMTANAALAEGLNACTEEQLAHETVSSAPGEGCPNESKIGTAEVETPLLEEPLKGSLFIAKPHANPFNSLLAAYFVLKNPTLGIIIKQAALIEPNPVTGQLVTTVENIPQLPFSHFKLHFREGARSPLVTPAACGTYNASAELTPWSGGPPVTTTSAFQIIAGANAGPCPTGGVPPFAPQVTTGTLNNNAGAYSQFNLRISRNDGEQELTRFSTTFPPGLAGNLTGIPFCPDAAIEAARGVTGAQETSEPSCPAASEIGHTIVGAGVGSTLAQAPGKIYLAGPYHGAPLSIVSITSATVGPFDLGTVVVRFALRINPITAQVELDSAGSDAIPHIIDGIVVNVREIHAYINRERFILNPTSCEHMSINNVVSGAGADFTNPADQVPILIASPFQAADCSSLKFSPGVSVATAGKASRANGTSLNFKIAYPKGAMGSESWFKEAKFTFPKQLPARLTTIQKACVAKAFEANPDNCPSAAKIGHAVVHTQILPVPLEGPVYFVSYGGAQFPEAVLVLKGYGITIDLHGETFIHNGVTSATFKSTPDVPFESIEVSLPAGPFSEFGANLPHESYDFCGRKLAIPTVFKAQNGLQINQNTPIAISGCAKAATKAKKLAAALKSCHKKRGKKRSTCEKSARAKYATAKKTSRSKRRGR
jgi:hypothetical protein